MTFLPHAPGINNKAVGSDDEKKKDIEHTRGEFDTDSTHHVPVNPTETSSDNGVLIMDGEGRPTNFFAQPGILAGEFTPPQER